MESTSTHPELERLLTHQDWLRSLARRLVGDAAAAEDLVQETWIAALKSPPDPSRPARPWLAGVVRRLASMRARGEGRRARRQTEVAKPDILPSTADLVEEVDTQRRLVSEVLELSEPYRTTVMLRYFQNMTSAEIARHQDVPAGTVRWRLKRGLDELRERLDQSFGSRDNWCIALLPLSKLGLGTGVAGTASAGTVVTGMAVLAKVAAGILAIWGLFEIPALLSSKADLVWARDPAAVLVSLQPEDSNEMNVDESTAVAEIVERDTVAPKNRRVRFLDGSREPVVGLRVVLDDGKDESPLSMTDEAGEVSFVTAMKQGDIYVQQGNSFLQRLQVEFTATGVDVILAGGAQLTGRVLAGLGEQASSIAMGQLALRLDSDRVLWEGGGLPRGIAAHFESASWIEATTDEFGAFHFQNLPRDWSGKLWLPSGVVVQGADRREQAGRYVYFDAPHSEAIVSVQRLPRLKGRALGLEGKPIEGAKVLCWLDGAVQPLVGTSGAEGYFDVQLDSDGRSGMRVELVSGNDLSRRVLQFAGDQIPDGFDLGEVMMGSTLRLSYRAVTPDGTAIEGAQVVGDGVLLAGVATNDEGYGEVQLPSDVEARSIQAFGFRHGEIPNGVRTQGLLAELAPAAMVTWHVMDDRGHSLEGVTLRVRSTGRLFADGDSHAPSLVDSARMLGTFVKRAGDEQPYGEFRADSTGRLQLSNLVQGGPIWVEVLDQFGHLIHEARLSGLVAGERRLETIVVPVRLQSFHGLVHDSSGVVLVGVELELADAEGQAVLASSGPDGQVLFEGLAGDHYELTVRKRGFVAMTLGSLSFSAGAGSSASHPYEIILERAADVTVLVVSGANVPVLGGSIVARRTLDGQEFSAAPIGSADQTLQDLDDGMLELTLTLGGVQYTEMARPHFDKSVEFRVPAHGAAQVTWSLPDTLDAKFDLTLVAVALDSEGRVLTDRDPVRVSIGERTGHKGVAHFQALLPGDYDLTLVGPTPDSDESTQSGDSQDPKTLGPLTAALRFHVGLKGPAQVEVQL